MKWYVASYRHYFSRHHSIVWEIAKSKSNLVKRLTFCQLQRAKFQLSEAETEEEVLNAVVY